MLLTAPNISIYSVTGRNYGKLGEVLFSPPDLYRFIGVLGDYIEQLPELEAADPADAAKLQVLRRHVERASSIGGPEWDLARSAFQWYIASVNDFAALRDDDDWNAEISQFSEPALMLAFATVLHPEAWTDRGFAFVSGATVAGFLMFVNETRNALNAEAEVSPEERAHAVAVLTKTEATARALLNYLERVAEGKEFYSLYPPPPRDRGAIDIEGEVSSIRLGKLPEGGLFAEAHGVALKFEDFYRPDTAATRSRKPIVIVTALIVGLLGVAAWFLLA